MVKFILFLVIGFYIILKVTGFILRILGMGFTPKNAPEEGEITVSKTGNKKDGTFGGGEYVEYEEVK